MKTLKRTLCLVLALVMVVGMMAVGASAAGNTITDADKIQYKVPVGVMIGMGIINGYDDGSFQPAKIVNRAEAAKMICYVLIGAEAADGLTCSENPFPDVPKGDWYAPYVAYLKAKGVVGGYDDGKFHAGDPVTGIQLAKMLLVAVGYGKQKEYDGTGFGTNTYVDALSKGSKSIFNGTKATNLFAGATREEAALYIYNAMCYVRQVIFSAGSQVLGIAAEYNFGGSNDTTRTLAFEKFGYIAKESDEKGAAVASAAGTTRTGYVVANSATDDGLAADPKAATTSNDYFERTTVRDAIAALSATGTIVTEATYKFESDLSLFGHKVSVYYGRDMKVFYVEDLASVVANTEVKATVADTYTSENLKKLGFKDTAAVATANTITGYSACAAGAAVPTTVGATMTLIANNKDGKLDTIVMTTAQTLSKVTDYKAPTTLDNGYITITGVASDGTINASAGPVLLNKIGSTTEDDIDLYDGIAKNDYVYVTKIGTNVTKVEKATVVSGTMTYRGTNATIAGKSYSFISAPNAYAITAGVAFTTIGVTDLANTEVSGTITRNFVLLSNGKVAGSYEYDGSTVSNYAVVLAVGATKAKLADVTNNFQQTDATAKAYLALADGTKVTYDMALTSAQKKIAASDADVVTAVFGSIAAGSVVKYSASSATTLSKIEAAVTTAGTVTKGSAATNVANKYYTADTKFVYWQSSDTDYNVSAYTGYANAPTGTPATIVFDSNNRAVFAYVNKMGGASSKNLIYLSSTTAATAYDETLKANVLSWTGYVDGVSTTLYAKDTTLSVTPSAIAVSTVDGTVVSKMGLYQYELVDGYVKTITALTSSTTGAKLLGDGYTITTSSIDTGTQDKILFTDGAALMFSVNGATAVEYNCKDAKAYNVSKDLKTITSASVRESSDSDVTTYIVVKTDASGTTPAVVSYIYYIAK